MGNWMVSAAGRGGKSEVSRKKLDEEVANRPEVDMNLPLPGY